MLLSDVDMMAWLTPTAPATEPATDLGMDRVPLARRSLWPFTLYRPSWMPNACSTLLADPCAVMNSRSFGTEPTARPSLRSQRSAAFTSALDGANLAIHCAVVR